MILSRTQYYSYSYTRSINKLSYNKIVHYTECAIVLCCILMDFAYYRLILLIIEVCHILVFMSPWVAALFQAGLQ